PVELVGFGRLERLVADGLLGGDSLYVMHATFQWYYELSRFCFVWMIFLGAAVSVPRGAHFRLHLLVDRFGPVTRRRVELLGTLVVVAFAAVLLAGGIAIFPIARRQGTDALEISMVWFYGALPVGGALMILL